MKKIAALLAVLPLLAAAGCNAKEEAVSETDYVLELDSLIISTEEETTETDAAPEETAETTTFAEETAVESVPEMTGVQQTAPPDEIITETSAALSVSELYGTWEYVDGYRIRFMEGRVAELLADYSGMMYFQEYELNYNGTLYPVKTEDEVTTVTADGELVLHLIAVDRTDFSNMNGRYRLEECTLYEELNGGPKTAASPVYYVEVDGNVLRAAAKVQYHADESGNLRMIEDGSDVALHYRFQNDQLVIYDETGAGDVLTRTE